MIASLGFSSWGVGISSIFTLKGSLTITAFMVGGSETVMVLVDINLLIWKRDI
jgi:hypothetical protein